MASVNQQSYDHRTIPEKCAPKICTPAIGTVRLLVRNSDCPTSRSLSVPGQVQEPRLPSRWESGTWSFLKVSCPTA